MTKFNILAPVVSTNVARVEIDIPENLVPKFKKFLTSSPDISWSSLEQFLGDNDLQIDSEEVDINDRINEACNEFESSNLYWETNDYAKVDFETEDFCEVDVSRDWILKGLAEVKESGATNMFDRQTVTELVDFNGYEDEADLIKEMTNQEYIELLQELSKWLEIKEYYFDRTKQGSRGQGTEGRKRIISTNVKEYYDSKK